MLRKNFSWSRSTTSEPSCVPGAFQTSCEDVTQESTLVGSLSLAPGLPLIYSPTVEEQGVPSAGTVRAFYFIFFLFLESR